MDPGGEVYTPEQGSVCDDLSDDGDMVDECIGEENYFGMEARVFPMTFRFTTDFGHFPIRTSTTFSAVLRFSSLIDSSE
jgi:hypothetical protein